MNRPPRLAVAPVPEVALDLALAGLTVEVDEGGGPRQALNRVRAGELFADVFTGRPGADYTLELIHCEVFRKPGGAGAPSSPSRYECRVTTRLKTVEGLERVLSARAMSTLDLGLGQARTMRDAVRLAVADLANQVRYQIAPVSAK